MPIEVDGDLWIGTLATDLPEYLKTYTQGEAYKATSFYAIACPCGSNRFSVVRLSGTTERTCVSCGEVRYVCRGGNEVGSECWEEDLEDEEFDEQPETFRCARCGGEAVEICLGFAPYAEFPGDSIQWYYVAVRCAACGVLDCFNDDKGGYSGADAYRLFAGEVDQE